MIVITYKDCFEAKISPKFLDLVRSFSLFGPAPV